MASAVNGPLPGDASSRRMALPQVIFCMKRPTAFSSSVMKTMMMTR